MSPFRAWDLPAIVDIGPHASFVTWKFPWSQLPRGSVASLMDDESGGLEKAAIGAAHAVRESVAFDSIYELGDEVGERYSCENDSSH